MIKDGRCIAVTNLSRDVENVALKNALRIYENIQAYSVLPEEVSNPMCISTVKNNTFYETMITDTLQKYYEYLPLQDIFYSDMYLISNKVIHITDFAHGYHVVQGLLLGNVHIEDVPRNYNRGGFFK